MFDSFAKHCIEMDLMQIPVFTDMQNSMEWENNKTAVH